MKEDEATLEELPLWQQGDEDMYNEENLQRRAALRRHPAIQEELERWWDLAADSLELIHQAAPWLWQTFACPKP